MLYTVPDTLQQLLSTARQTTVIVRAIGAPFEAKDELKRRGYRWDGGDKGHPRYWWREVSNQEVAGDRQPRIGGRKSLLGQRPPTV